jgi:hypothetical protein
MRKVKPSAHIGTGQRYSWHHRLLSRRPAEAVGFARVEMTGEPPRLTGASAISPPASGLIEIALPDGASVRVDAQVDEPALRRVLAALDRR